jgi:hypothetical protein
MFGESRMFIIRSAERICWIRHTYPWLVSPNQYSPVIPPCGNLGLAF